MATFLSSALAIAALIQAPAPTDSLDALRARVAADSGDAKAWFALGQGLVRRSSVYHTHRVAGDTAWARAILDTADQAFAKAATLYPGTAAADSARVFRVFTWADRALLAWELGGIETAAQTWTTLPGDLKLPPVLEELGENLLRACPREGVLIAGTDADAYAAWYLRFTRGLRPDVLIVPLAVWRGDTVFQDRVRRELKLDHRPRADAADDSWMRVLAGRRPLCASMVFDRPPGARARVSWSVRPLVWVAGPEAKQDRVPARDFVFAALRLALDQHDTWAASALAVYRRAAALTPGLCDALATFQLKSEVGCRR
jgi:hypothetical protein